MTSAVELAPGCWSDGRVAGSTATLLVDPVAGGALAEVDGGQPVHVLFTTVETVVPLPGLSPATVFVHASAVAAATAAVDSAGSDGGSSVRGVHAAAFIDLGGIVAEITHLGAGRSSSDLVVSARVVDGRGVPLRTVPPIVYVGELLDPGEHAVSAPVEGGTEQMWAASLDLLGGLLGTTGIVVRRSGVTATPDDVESQRGMRLERGGLIRMPDPDKRLPLL